NRNECIDYAVSHGHMNAEEGEKIKRLNEGGPGGCKNQEECRTFCENPENQTACIDFAEKEGFMTPEQAAQARKFANKKGPGGCSNREECDRFCNQEENQETCIRYAVDEGMMSPEQAERILSLMEEGGHYRDEFEVHDIGPKEPKIDKEKAMRIVEEEGGPGGCGTFEECEAFCSDPANGETCMNFALEHGLIPPEEAERMRHMMSVEGPGGCRGRECEEYCEAPGRERECIEFASREGLVTPEEAEKIKKFIDATEAGGPGGCIGRECETYCNAPEHRDECFEFAKKQGLFPEEHLRRMEEMMKMEREMRQSGDIPSPEGMERMMREKGEQFMQEGMQNIPPEYRQDGQRIFNEEMRRRTEEEMRHRMEQYGGSMPPGEYGGFDSTHYPSEEEMMRMKLQMEQQMMQQGGSYPIPSDGTAPPPAGFEGEMRYPTEEEMMRMKLQMEQQKMQEGSNPTDGSYQYSPPPDGSYPTMEEHSRRNNTSLLAAVANYFGRIIQFVTQ
ncbi:hypothetical protein L0Y49_04045, partial [bacterium]|nr:hypothetical protein [bacterium]